MRNDVPLECAVIAWSGDAPQWFRIIDLRGYEWFQGHYKDAGAVYTKWRTMETKDRLLNLFGEVMTAMVRDKIPFSVVHPELMKIPEFRRCVLSHDTPGAEGEENWAMFGL